VFANSQKVARLAVDMILECIESNDFKTRFVAHDSNDQYKDKTGVRAMNLQTLPICLSLYVLYRNNKYPAYG
jgi:hypothetical protein